MFCCLLQQYEDALKAMKSGRSFDYTELPNPPGTIIIFHCQTTFTPVFYWSNQIYRLYASMRHTGTVLILERHLVINAEDVDIHRLLAINSNSINVNKSTMLCFSGVGLTPNLSQIW